MTLFVYRKMQGPSLNIYRKCEKREKYLMKLNLQFVTWSLAWQCSHTKWPLLH